MEQAADPALVSQVNEIEQDREMVIARNDALTDQLKAQNELNRAAAKFAEARATLRSAWTLAILVGIGIAIFEAVHFG